MDFCEPATFCRLHGLLEAYPLARRSERVIEMDSPRIRRTQEQRSADTRKALVEGAIRAISRLGYGGATTAAIAEEAGISRGSIIFHFSTRAELMAEVLRTIYEQERRDYDELEREAKLGGHLEDWVDMCWQVLSKPTGLAFLEIQMAARSDPELAEKVASVSVSLDQTGAEVLMARFGGSPEQVLAAIRMVVWAIRGYSIAKMIVPDPEEMNQSIELFKRMYHAGIKAGVFGPKPATKS
jgi:AcrR family transcriptional regulator